MLFHNNDILDSFYEVNKAIFRLIKKEADKVELTVIQLVTLYKLSSNPNITLGELAEKLRLSNSTMSGVTDRLVQRGLVEKIIPPENRRSVSICLTGEGKELLERIISEESVFSQKLTSLMELPEDDLQELFRLHKLILSKLSLEEE